MKTQHIKHRIRAGNIVLTLWLSLLTTTATLAQDLIVHLGYTPTLNEQQQKYLRTVTENPVNENIRFVEVNMEALKGDRLTLNLGNAERYEVQKVKRGQNSGSTTSWCGQIIGFENGGGSVNTVRVGQELVGHFTVDHFIYSVTHIGNGLHVFYEVNTDNVGTKEGHTDAIKPPGKKDKLPEFTNTDYVNNLSDAKSTTDCNIRVLVGFTPQAEAQYTSLIAQISNLFNLANDALDDGNVEYNIELAHAYRVNYTATANNSENLERWWNTSDGFMDEVHFLRGLWRADQCALIVPGDGGIAYYDIEYESQFSVTGSQDFNFYTFHHELAHNMLCTHDVVNTIQPGVAPYAGYGHPSGCFRTVMAYPEACGTGPCPLANAFSSELDQQNCDGNWVIPGNSNARNTSRLFLSRPTVIEYEPTVVNGFYTLSYAATANEAIHITSLLTLTYSGFLGSTFTFFDGSQGSFRSTEIVTLGPGFQANEGSFFRASVGDCSRVFYESIDEGDAGDLGNLSNPKSSNNSYDQPDTKIQSEELVKMYPNPFNQVVTVEFTTNEFERVSIDVFNMMGQKVMQVLNKPNLAPGPHRIIVDTGDLPSGMYTIVVDTSGERTVNKVIKNR